MAAKKKTTMKNKFYPYGGVMLIETVTKFYVGTVTDVLPQEIVLKDAAWIADTGRYNEFLKTGDGGGSSEFEPCPDGPCVIGRGSVVCAQPFRFPPIRTVK